MGFFTCNLCGEALKKKAVEKHNYRCRVTQGLSCLDCGQTFWRNDYTTHDSCTTEEEKYGGSNVISKKSIKPSKQEIWMENLKVFIQDNNDIEPNIKKFLQKLTENSTVPKKEKKFKNFVINGLHLKPFEADKIWIIIKEAAAGVPAKINGTNHVSPTLNMEKEGNSEDKQEENKLDNIKLKEGEECKVKSKKKKKKSKEGEECKVKSKKKKKKSKEGECDINDSETIINNGNQNSMEKETEVNQKENKCKRKLKDDDESEITKPKKKKSKGNDCTNVSENSDSPQKQILVLNGSQNSAKKKNKKSKERDSNMTVTENGHAEDNALVSVTDASSTFKWKASIKQALKGMPEGKMKLKKLEKKMVSEFLTQNGVDDTEENKVGPKTLFRDKILGDKFKIEGKFVQLK